MNGLTKEQVRVVAVLQKMIELTERDCDLATVFSDELEDMLEALACEDCFGTERQNDPRGDVIEFDYLHEKDLRNKGLIDQLVDGVERWRTPLTSHQKHLLWDIIR